MPKSPTSRLLLGPQILDALQGGIAVLHDVRRPPLQVGHFLAMAGDRHLRPNAARRPNVRGILQRLFLFAALPFIVAGSADVVEEPIDALPDPRHGDDQPFFELADQRVPLGFEHGHFALVFGKAADVLLGRPEALLVGDAQVLVEFRHERNRLHAHPLEQVHGGRVPLKPFRELVQTLGDLHQNLGRGFHLSGGGVQIDAHPAQGGPRLLALLELSSAAWERPRMRRSTIEMSCPTARAAKPNCPTSFAAKPVRSSASFTRVPYSPRLFAASNADTAMVPRTAAPAVTPRHQRGQEP